MGERRRRVWTPITPVPENAPPPRCVHFKFKEPNTVWEYRDGDGRLLGAVARYDRPADGDKPARKEVLPWTWCRDEDGTQEWRNRAWEKPRPIYGLDRLAEHPNASVLIVEGEKAADRAQALTYKPDWVAISWPGGSKALKHIDWEPLNGRICALWADADKPGAEAMDDLTQLLHQVGAVTFHIEQKVVAEMLGVEHPPKGWDIADAPDDWNADKVSIILEDARPVARLKATSGDELPVCDPHKDADEVRRICAGFSLTDQGNAHRLIERYGDTLRYSRTHRQWVVWSGKHWKTDRSDIVNLYAMRCAELIGAEAQEPQGGLKAKDYFDHSTNSQSRKRRENMIADAIALPGVTVEDQDLWDSNPHLLITQSGTVDLRTGKQSEHRREDLCMRITPVAYSASAQHPMLRRLLDAITGGDRDYERFIQMALGYSLLGHNELEAVFIVWGKGNTGKTTLMEACKRAIGADYGATAQFASFLRSSADRIRSDLARLSGPRFVHASESDEGQRLDSAVVKQLSGGATFTSRFLYGEDFEFEPRFTLWLDSNNKPVFDGADSGMQRRLHILPMNRVVPEDERDPAVKRDLLHTDAGRRAVLAWLIQGCVRFHQAGERLTPPEIVVKETARTLEEMDPIGEWMASLEFGSRYWITAKDLRADLELYFEGRDIKPPSGKRVAPRLRDLGCISDRAKVGQDKKTAACWFGVTLPGHESLQETLPVTPVTSVTPDSETLHRGENDTARARDARARAVASEPYTKVTENEVTEVTGVTDDIGDLDDAEPPF